MAFGLRKSLATLLIHIAVNSKGVNAALSGVKGNAVNLAAKFYLVRAAVDAITQSFGALVRISSEVETGFLKIERVAENLRGGTFRRDFFDFAGDGISGEKIATLQETMASVARLGVTSEKSLFGLTKVIAQFSRVTGVSAEEAALSLGRLGNLFNFEDEIESTERLASSIINVAESLPVTEREIIQIVSRLGAITKAGNISPADTIALAGAVKATGQRTQVSATALANAISKVLTRTGQLGKAFGLSNAEILEFFDMFEKDAIVGFEHFLKLLSEADFTTQTIALKELGLSGFRTTSAIRALSGSVKDWKDIQKAANDGASLNIELMEDFEAQAHSLRAEIANLGNAFTELFDRSADNTKLGNVLRELTDFVDRISNTILPEIDEADGLPRTREGLEAVIKKRQEIVNRANKAVQFELRERDFTYKVFTGDWYPTRWDFKKKTQAHERAVKLLNEAIDKRSKIIDKDIANEATKKGTHDLGAKNLYLEEQNIERREKLEDAFSERMKQEKAANDFFADEMKRRISANQFHQNERDNYNEDLQKIAEKRKNDKISDAMAFLSKGSPVQISGLTEAWRRVQGQELSSRLDSQVSLLRKMVHNDTTKITLLNKQNLILEETKKIGIVTGE